MNQLLNKSLSNSGRVKQEYSDIQLQFDLEFSLLGKNTKKNQDILPPSNDSSTSLDYYYQGSLMPFSLKHENNFALLSNNVTKKEMQNDLMALNNLNISNRSLSVNSVKSEPVLNTATGEDNLSNNIDIINSNSVADIPAALPMTCSHSTGDENSDIGGLFSPVSGISIPSSISSGRRSTISTSIFEPCKSLKKDRISRIRKGKTSHNDIEKKYRLSINDKIVQLREIVPSIRYGYKEISNIPIEDKDILDLDGLQPTRKMNKGTILNKTIEYIKHLEAKCQEYKLQNEHLVNTFSREKLDNKDNTINGSENDEKGENNQKNENVQLNLKNPQFSDPTSGTIHLNNETLNMLPHQPNTDILTMNKDFFDDNNNDEHLFKFEHFEEL